ncbi:hypothetical protein Patl1_14160 [Pistacia atlantica]|uniref:Uncharacterized protein n=1 Tax=Pistacia atlantica TaxID=434234 RepID=A0ACC1AWF2_9ROSI|nr:hypothetical protein Patl1_14160 [Pistacia atlantica]
MAAEQPWLEELAVGTLSAVKRLSLQNLALKRFCQGSNIFHYCCYLLVDINLELCHGLLQNGDLCLKIGI